MDRVNFLRQNPVLEGMQQGQQIENARSRGELLDMEVQRDRDAQRQEGAATEALNRIYARGGNLSSGEVQRQLAADPMVGGTRRLQALRQAEAADLQNTQIDAQAKERQARAFKLYVDSGMFAAAAEEAKRMGMNIPPQFWQDQEKVRALKQRLDVEDKQASIRQKNASAGANRALASNRQPDSYEDFTDDQGRVVRRDKATGQSQYITGPDGQPIRTTSRDTARTDVARLNNEARIKVAELQARARTETGAARDATMREIARIQSESREAVALGNQGARLSQIEVQQQGANERARGQNESREAIELHRGGAALNRTETQQQGANERNAETNKARMNVAEGQNQSRESIATGNRDAKLDQTQMQQEGADRRAQARNAGQGGRPLNIEARRQMLIDAGIDPQQAALIAGGAAVTPAQRAQIRQRIQAGVVGAKDNVGRPQFRTPAEQQAEAARREADVFGQQPGASAAPQQEGAAPAQGAAAPQAANGLPAPRSLAERDALPPGTRYVDPNGQVRVKR
jgi:hypothetical protein